MTLLIAVLAALCIWLFGLFWTYRKRFYIATGRDQNYAIPTVKIAEFDPRFRVGPHGPTHDAEVAFIGGAESVKAGVTDREAWILSVLAKDARMIFEFGTATGKTAYLLARNSPAAARVVTLTLAPLQRADYRHEPGDRDVARKVALEESAFSDFLYTGTPEEAKITQLYGDSKTFDHSPFVGRCNLIFVDGAHAYSYVMSDSTKAFEMLAPGGVILWHDYKKRSGPPRDVVRALDQIARERKLVRLNATHLVAYRDGAA